jgi:hypothetical protein
MTPSGDCLDETIVARLLDHSLSGVERDRVACHIDSCRDCRELIVALARSQGAVIDSDRPSFTSLFLPPTTDDR